MSLVGCLLSGTLWAALMLFIARMASHKWHPDGGGDE